MEYEIKGAPMPVLTVCLDRGETVVTQKGAMVWMSPTFRLETVGGGVKKMFSRLLTGEAMFQNRYTAEADDSSIAFAPSFPGHIVAVEVTPTCPVIAQKSAFLAATEGIETSVFLQKRAGVGFFGGEGFIMQQFSGNGTVFLEIDGTPVEKELAMGESLTVSTGNLAFMDASCTMEIETVKGAKNVLFGGEGLFLTVVHGPGKVTLQSMTVAGLAESLIPYLPRSSDNG